MNKHIFCWPQNMYSWWDYTVMGLILLDAGTYSRGSGEQPNSVPMLYIGISSQSFGDSIIYHLLLTSLFEDNNILYM